MSPESVGLMRGDSQSGAGIVLGKHSGRNAVSTRLRELGYDVDAEKLNAVFVRFKEVAERKKGGLDDDELEALVADEVYSAQALWSLKRVQVSTGSDVVPTATVALIGPDGVERQTAGTGTGPVDAAYKAIDDLTSVKVDLMTSFRRADIFSDESRRRRGRDMDIPPTNRGDAAGATWIVR